MIQKSFASYLLELSETAKILGDRLDSRGIPNAEMIMDYLPSMISAESESIQLVVEKEFRSYWTPQLQENVREQLNGIEDEYGIPCRLKVTYA